MRITSSLIIASSLAASTAAYAQDPAPAPTTEGTRAITLGANLMVVLPLGDYASQGNVDLVTFALGGLVRGEMALSPELSVTGRLGYVYNSVDLDGYGLSFIPLLAGVSYRLGGSGLSVYGELGLDYITSSIDLAGLTRSDSEIKPTAGFGLGFQKDQVKARLGLWMPGSGDLGNGSTTLYGIAASVGYDFATL